jgi:hypothetical protein
MESIQDDNLNDDGFDNYEPKTIDPGPWMLVGVSVYSIFCAIILPFLVVIGNKRERRRIDRNAWNEDDDSTPNDSVISSGGKIGHMEVDFKSPNPSATQRRRNYNSDTKVKNPYSSTEQPSPLVSLKIVYYTFPL